MLSGWRIVVQRFAHGLNAYVRQTTKPLGLVEPHLEILEWNVCIDIRIPSAVMLRPQVRLNRLIAPLQIEHIFQELSE